MQEKIHLKVLFLEDEGVAQPVAERLPAECNVPFLAQENKNLFFLELPAAAARPYSPLHPKCPE